VPCAVFLHTDSPLKSAFALQIRNQKDRDAYEQAWQSAVDTAGPQEVRGAAAPLLSLNPDVQPSAPLYSRSALFLLLSRIPGCERHLPHPSRHKVPAFDPYRIIGAMKSGPIVLFAMQKEWGRPNSMRKNGEDWTQ